MARERERVGQEAQQLARVLDAAVAQVLERLGDRARRGERQLGELGVRLGLAAEQDQRDPVALAQRRAARDALRPRPAPAEQADDDRARAGDERRRVVDRRRVGRAHLGEVRRRARAPRRRRRGSRCRRSSADGARGPPGRSRAARPGAPFSISSSSAGASTCAPNQSARRSRCASRTSAKRVGRASSRARGARRPRQQRAPDLVALEQAVPGGAEHVPGAAAAASSGSDAAVADLVAARLDAPARSPRHLLQQLLGRERGPHRQQPEALDAPARRSRRRPRSSCRASGSRRRCRGSGRGARAAPGRARRRAAAAGPPRSPWCRGRRPGRRARCRRRSA